MKLRVNLFLNCSSSYDLMLCVARALRQALYLHCLCPPSCNWVRFCWELTWDAWCSIYGGWISSNAHLVISKLDHFIITPCSQGQGLRVLPLFAGRICKPIIFGVYDILQILLFEQVNWRRFELAYSWMWLFLYIHAWYLAIYLI